MTTFRSFHYSDDSLNLFEMGRLDGHIHMGNLGQHGIDPIRAISMELANREVNSPQSAEGKEYVQGFRFARDEAVIGRIML